jgi:hypothetical protein
VPTSTQCIGKVIAPACIAVRSTAGREFGLRIVGEAFAAANPRYNARFPVGYRHCRAGEPAAFAGAGRVTRIGTLTLRV